jgi:AhpD family alkylhydroperoxidase
MPRISPASRKASAVLARSDDSPCHRGSAIEYCNFVQLLANSEAITGAYKAWDKGLARGHLTGKQRHLIALAVAEINGSKYCLSAHFARGRKAGLSDEEMRLARRGAAADAHTHALLQFVQEITLQRGR